VATAYAAPPLDVRQFTMTYIFIRIIHFLGIILITSALVHENLSVSKTLTPKAAKKIALVDAAYGVGALLALISGLIMWLGVGKPSPFYSQNPVFHVKLSIFLVTAILSIKPTLFFLKARKSVVEIEVPSMVLRLVRIQLVLISFIPILAVLIAQGIGLK